MAQFCPHCDVVLTHYEAFEKRCHSCGQEFAAADERGSVAAAHPHPTGAFGGSRHCRFCGREGAVDPCFLRAGRAASAGPGGQWLNVRCDACPWCRFRVKLYTYGWPALIALGAVVIPVALAAGPALLLALFRFSADAVSTAILVGLIAAALWGVGFLIWYLVDWRRRLHRLIGAELDAALRASNGGRRVVRVALVREIPAQEESVPIHDFLSAAP